MSTTVKRFLHPTDDGGASVRYSVFDFTPNEKPLSGYLEANMNITDCYRSVALEFSAFSYPEYLKKLEKLNNFIEILTQFKKDFEGSYPEPTPQEYADAWRHDGRPTRSS